MAADRRLDGRVVAITGASRGFGAAVAELCAAEGAKLVLVARTRGALEEVDDRVRRHGEEATLVALDITDGKMVDTLGRALFERFGRLDGLVGAAAELGPITPVSHLEGKVLERVMAVNALANHRLIRSLDPLLRPSESGSGAGDESDGSGAGDESEGATAGDTEAVSGAGCLRQRGPAWCVR